MILDAALMFTGGPGGIGTAPPGTTLRIADNVTATGATSNNILDLALGQTSTAGVNPVGGLPPATQIPIGVGPNVQPSRDIGIGDDPALKILVQTVGASWGGTTSTLVVALQGAPDNGSGAPGAFFTFYSSASVTGTQINTTTGGQTGLRLMDMDMPRPPALNFVPRFLQLLYTVGVASFTGTSNFLVAGLVLDRADQMFNATINTVWGGYPAGVVVAN
jgi:hypothetical protein